MIQKGSLPKQKLHPCLYTLLINHYHLKRYGLLRHILGRRLWEWTICSLILPYVFMVAYIRLRSAESTTVALPLINTGFQVKVERRAGNEYYAQPSYDTRWSSKTENDCRVYLHRVGDDLRRVHAILLRLLVVRHSPKVIVEALPKINRSLENIRTLVMSVIAQERCVLQHPGYTRTCFNAVYNTAIQLLIHHLKVIISYRHLLNDTLPDDVANNVMMTLNVLINLVYATGPNEANLFLIEAMKSYGFYLNQHQLNYDGTHRIPGYEPFVIIDTACIRLTLLDGTDVEFDICHQYIRNACGVNEVARVIRIYP